MVEVSATSMPAAFMQGDMVYEVITGHSKVVTVAVTPIVPTIRGVGAGLNSSPPEQPNTSKAHAQTRLSHAAPAAKFAAAIPSRIDVSLARAPRYREVSQCGMIVQIPSDNRKSDSVTNRKLRKWSADFARNRW